MLQKAVAVSGITLICLLGFSCSVSLIKGSYWEQVAGIAVMITMLVGTTLFSFANRGK